MRYAVEVIGWAAAAMMLSAYLLLTSGRLTSRSLLYQWLNDLSGAGFIGTAPTLRHLLTSSGWRSGCTACFVEREHLLPPHRSAGMIGLCLAIVAPVRRSSTVPTL